jgi:hypothetical protein
MATELREEEKQSAHFTGALLDSGSKLLAIDAESCWPNSRHRQASTMTTNCHILPAFQSPCMTVKFVTGIEYVGKRNKLFVRLTQILARRILTSWVCAFRQEVDGSSMLHTMTVVDQTHKLGWLFLETFAIEKFLDSIPHQ